MEPVSAKRLSGLLTDQSSNVCHRVAGRLLTVYPELRDTLRLEEAYPAQNRLAEVSVERLNELVRGILLFELLSLADTEFTWAHDILPRNGVAYFHQEAMIRWYFEEILSLELHPAERTAAREVEYYLLNLLREIYPRN